MTKLLIAVALSLAVTAAGNVAGKWTMTVDTGSAHGITTMGLTLKQDGKTLSGTFHSPHGDLAVTGEFTEDTLRLSTSANAEMSVTFSAKLRDDGTLAGYLSTSRGDMKFTAEKAREGEKK
jgi:hypothetical protein